MIPPDLHSQMLRMLDGELSTGELAALEAELMENPAARKAWQKLSRLHSTLEVRYQSQAVAAKTPVVPIERVLARQRRRTVKTSLLAAAAVVLVSALALWMNMVPERPVETTAGFQTAPNSLFLLTHAGDREKPMGNLLAEGSRLLLEHGVAELKLPHEVSAVIEAPAAMTLVDARTLRLDHGRVFFRVSSPEAHGFTVITPQQRIVDLGTAFGIDADAARSEVELHVFEGRVRIDALDGTEGEIINTNRSVLLAAARVARDLDGPSVAFRRNLPANVEMVLHEDFESGLVADRDYAVQIDPTAIRDLAGNRFRGIDDDEIWNFSTKSPSTVPIPVASYVYGTNPESQPQPIDFQNGSISDIGNVKLTDGQLGVGDWHCGANVGFRNDADSGAPQPRVTFDLGGIFHVATIDIGSVGSFLGNESLSVSSSVDGETFTTPITVNPLSWKGGFANASHLRASVDVSSLPGGQYYRLDFFDPGQWMMLNEVQFAAHATVRHDNAAESHGPHDPVPGAAPRLSELDETPPALLALHPTDDATDAIPGGPLTMVFDEPVKFGTGRIILRNLSDWSEREIAVGGPRTSIDGRIVTITPPTDLRDGDKSVARINGWKSGTWVGIVNPAGDGTWYADEDLRDKGRGRGTIGSMRGPVMATFGPGTWIRREFAAIAPDSRYTVSAAIGVRGDTASPSAVFLGYTIRLLSGTTVLAELADATPPGPPNSVTRVGFSWDSSTLPEGLDPGAPLAIRIAPSQSAILEPGYLDLDDVRVTVVRN